MLMIRIMTEVMLVMVLMLMNDDANEDGVKGKRCMINHNDSDNADGKICVR